MCYADSGLRLKCLRPRLLGRIHQSMFVDMADGSSLQVKLCAALNFFFRFSKFPSMKKHLSRCSKGSIGRLAVLSNHHYADMFIIYAHSKGTNIHKRFRTLYGHKSFPPYVHPFSGHPSGIVEYGGNVYLPSQALSVQFRSQYPNVLQ